MTQPRGISYRSDKSLTAKRALFARTITVTKNRIFHLQPSILSTIHRRPAASKSIICPLPLPLPTYAYVDIYSHTQCRCKPSSNPPLQLVHRLTQQPIASSRPSRAKPLPLKSNPPTPSTMLKLRSRIRKAFLRTSSV